MTARCSTPETICLLCGDRGWSNAFVYCVKCLNVAVHRYCMDVVPSTVDEFVHWVCDFCDHSTSSPSSSTVPSTTVATASLQPAPTPTPSNSAGKAAAPARDDKGPTQEEMAPKRKPEIAILKSKVKSKKEKKSNRPNTRNSNPRIKKEKAVQKPMGKLRKELIFEDEDNDSIHVPAARKVKQETNGKEMCNRKRRLRDEDDEDIEEKLANVKLKKKAPIEKVEVTGGAVSSRGNMDSVFYLIRSKLSQNNIKEFKATAFGHLLDVPPIQFQGQLFFLLLNVLDTSFSGSGSLVFRLNDSLLKFGETEFVTITGLNMKNADMLPSSSCFHTEIFGGKEKMFANEIRQKFIEECGGEDAEGQGDSELCLQLALLLVVYGLFTNKDMTNKRIQVSLMHLLDDMDSFNNYPWGRVAFDFLELNLYHVAKNVRTKRFAKRPSVDVCGFAIPLQVWVYEIFPKFARQCASVAVPDAFPRILRWSVAQFFTYSYIKSFFTPCEGNTVLPFVLSDDDRDKIRELVMPANPVSKVAKPSSMHIGCSTMGQSKFEERIHDSIEAMKQYVSQTLDVLKVKLQKKLELFEDEILNSVRAYIESEVVAAAGKEQKHEQDEDEKHGKDEEQEHGKEQDQEQEQKQDQEQKAR